MPVSELNMKRPIEGSQGVPPTRSYPYHIESTRLVAAPAGKVFGHLDDPLRLSAHMSRSSWMMAGSSMEVAVDAARGMSVGSKITMQGRMLGMTLSLEELVTERIPPVRKVWETIGTPALLVIGHYRMGYDVTAQGASSLVRIFIDYDRPTAGIWRPLAVVFAPVYARWCTENMVNDVARQFDPGRNR